MNTTGSDTGARERIARIIDPEAFEKLRVKLPDWAERQKTRARCDALAKADEILASLPAAEGEWQPIGTAPRDGTRLLIARYAGQRCLWVYDAEPSPNISGHWMHGGVGLHPTHWRPHPAPPGETPAKPEGEWVLVPRDNLEWIVVFADIRSQDDSKTFARVNRGALRTIRDKAAAMLSAAPSSDGEQGK